MDFEKTYRNSIGPFDVYDVDPTIAAQFLSSKFPGIASQKTISRIPSNHVYADAHKHDLEIQQYLLKHHPEALGYKDPPLDVELDEPKVDSDIKPLLLHLFFKDGPFRVYIVDADQLKKILPWFEDSAIGAYSVKIPHDTILISNKLPEKIWMPLALSCIIEYSLLTKGFTPKAARQQSIVKYNMMLSAMRIK